jgi:hypothetical protein
MMGMQGYIRSLFLLFVSILTLLSMLPFSPTVFAATGDILPPFTVGETWCIYQGYSSGTHTGTSQYGLDLSIPSSGTCISSTSAAGKTVRAPISGTLAYAYQSDYGNLCVNITGGGSYTLTHIDSTITGSVTAGQVVGTVAAAQPDPNAAPRNNNVAHIHFEIWSSPNCYNSSVIPFDDAHGARICGALNMTATGGTNNNGIWGKTIFTGDTCGTTSTVSFRPAVILRPSGETDVAVVGPGNTLAFYYNAAGSPNFGGGVIPGSEAYSTPAMLQRPSGETVIVVQGPNNSLLFYFNAQGSNSWGKLVIPGAVAYSAPTVVQRASGEIDIAVQGANNTLAFYYNAAGSPNFGGGSIPGTQAYGEPAMIQRPTGETDIAVQGAGNSMNMYYNALGSSSWGTSTVAAPGWALSAPSIAQRSTGETDIAVQGPGNSLDFYINAQGSNAWGRIPVAGGGTTFSAPNPPAMLLRSSGETNIAIQGPNNGADFYFNAPGSPNWGKITAAVSGYAFRAPAMVQRPTSGETDLVIIGPNNRLDFYYNAQGSPYWSNIPLAGNNSAS